MLRLLTICLLVTALAAPAGAEILEHIVYTPTSLPSAQGWTFGSQNLDEDEVFSLQDGVLVMDTMGSPIDETTWVTYTYQVPQHADAAGAVVRWRARVTASEAQPHAYPQGFFFSGWPLASWYNWYWFNLDSDRLYSSNLPIQELDATAWHDYLLTCTQVGGERDIELTVDGETVAYPPDSFSGALSGVVIFGDMGLDANARVEIAEIEIIVSTDAVPTQSASLSSLRRRFDR